MTHTNMTINKHELFDKEILLQVANTTMPFGKYKGRMLIDLPEEYLIWFSRQGFPTGQLGILLETTLGLKIEGLDTLVKPLKSKK